MKDDKMNAAVMTMSETQLDALATVMKCRRDLIDNKVRSTLRTNQKVMINHQSFPHGLKGIVVRVNPKNVVVETAHGDYSVPPQYLTAIIDN